MVALARDVRVHGRTNSRSGRRHAPPPEPPSESLRPRAEDTSAPPSTVHTRSQGQPSAVGTPTTAAGRRQPDRAEHPAGVDPVLRRPVGFRDRPHPQGGMRTTTPCRLPGRAPASAALRRSPPSTSGLGSRLPPSTQGGLRRRGTSHASPVPARVGPLSTAHSICRPHACGALVPADPARTRIGCCDDPAQQRARRASETDVLPAQAPTPPRRPRHTASTTATALRRCGSPRALLPFIPAATAVGLHRPHARAGVGHRRDALDARGGMSTSGAWVSCRRLRRGRGRSRRPRPCPRRRSGGRRPRRSRSSPCGPTRTGTRPRPRRRPAAPGSPGGG